MTRTVIQHVLSRLKDLGITDVFGVPGDYSFAVCDAVCHDPELRWVGCSNELNAAYAADGYARIRGAAALSTTFGVGELSAINGVAGAYAEHLPVFHLVGTPDMATQAKRALMHHTLGNGEYDVYRRMGEPVVCASAVMTPQNVAYETERLIAEALYHRRPVYMAFPADLADQPVVGQAQPIPAPQSDPAMLQSAAAAIVKALEAASTACVVPGILVARTGARDALERLVDATGLPFAPMFMGKSILDEQHPAYAGIYDGRLMNEDVRAFVESADRVLLVGAPMTDFNSGAFTANLEPARIIHIAHHRAVLEGRVYPNVEMGELLTLLAQKLGARAWNQLAARALGPASGHDQDALDANALYPRCEQFIRPNDIVVAETGTVSMGLGFARLPKGATFHNQTLWGSIGWATPAAFGAAIAAPDRRVVLFTGDGSHQLTAQEVGQFGRYGVKPIIVLLNNDGYLIERLLCKEPQSAYNDIAPWRYTELPHALGCDGWFVARAVTCAEFDAALLEAREAREGAYIEVVTDAYAASDLARKLGDGLKALRREAA
jgi:indolepyruvate decarboxylase